VVDFRGAKWEFVSQVLLYSQNQLKTLLLNASHNVNMWLCKVRKMKAVYHHLNMFDVDINRSKCFIGEYWVPTKFLNQVTNAVHTSAVSDDVLCFYLTLWI